MRLADRMFSSALDHLGLKVAALVCSAGLWAFLAGQDMAERTVGVPFNLRQDVRNLPAGTAVLPAGRAPLSVAVRLRGRRSRLKLLDVNQIRVRLDLDGATVGKVYSPPIIVDPPIGFSVIDHDPVAVRVRVETVIETER